MLPMIIGFLLCLSIWLVIKEIIKTSKGEKKIEEVKSELDEVRLDSTILDYKEELDKEKKNLGKRYQKLNKL